MFKDIPCDVEMGKVVRTTSGGTPSRKHDEYYLNGDVCWVKSKELQSGYIIDTEEKINTEAIKNSSAKLLPARSVLIAMYGATVGAHGIISKEMTCNQAICAILQNDDYPFTYLFQIAKEYQNKLVNMAVGSAQQNISQVLIQQLMIHGDLNTIRNFHEVALPIHYLIENNSVEIVRLTLMRDALLPKLMSGEIDVSEVMI